MNTGSYISDYINSASQLSKKRRKLKAKNFRQKMIFLSDNEQ